MKAMGKITIALILVASLLLTSCSSGIITPGLQPNLENLENIEAPVIEAPAGTTGTESPQKWSGLTGFVAWYDNVSSYGDIWVENEFNEWRDLRDYTSTTDVNGSKAAVLVANGKGIKCVWGVSSNPTTITAENWVNFRQAILNAAQWAQDNGVYEFQIGNEEEYHVDGTTMTVAQIITNLKSVAKDAQAIFTNGDISYSCAHNYIDNWIAAGKGDIDILASNVYIGGEGYYTEGWKTEITNLVNAFGVDGTYISEFGPSYSSLEDYSTDEVAQAEAVTEMINYMKAAGIERALFYCWHDYPGGLLGVLKNDENYRLLWTQALINTEPVKFATIPTKTNTISLPDTIALIPSLTPE